MCPEYGHLIFVFIYRDTVQVVHRYRSASRTHPRTIVCTYMIYVYGGSRCVYVPRTRSSISAIIK
jgi:hypothetical protein